MPDKRKSARSAMQKHVSAKTADAILKKVESMAKKKAAPKAIQNAIKKDLSKKMDAVLGQLPIILWGVKGREK